jgi:EpsI family protein
VTGRDFLTRFSLVLALFVGTACVLFARPAERVPVSEPLAQFPTRIGEWTGTDIPIPPDTREVLGPGDFLERAYLSSNSLPVELFVAYFPSQSAGDTIHSPKNCLPGSGWIPVQSSYVWLALVPSERVQVNRYVIVKGHSRQLVMYWFQAHGRVVASEYWAKIYLVADAIRMNRTDGALVRLVTPILTNEADEQAMTRLTELASEIVLKLPRFIPN